MTRSLSPLVVFFLLLVAPCLVSAYSIELPAATKECFFEDLHTNDKMTVTYQAGGGGHMDIDFWLTDPDGQALHKDVKQSTGTVSITAKRDGKHEYCFSNLMSSVSDKVVSFNVHGVIYVGDDDIVAPVEREIRGLANDLKTVRDEQEYILVRERRHRNTAESTNSRVKWWSIVQSIVLFLVVAWQVYYVKSFFEIKRVI
ncbi:emp24/gp25L/p24 family/GOLD-domain-containing protein [Thelephora terrestris]|uniref:Emp24/gp25L/p24 family/GOLD-domain-containing protein n=1 Tax=Thelephora terrestris TaxID=56493 RepID=A0A9P6L3A3_9AGAM|nr:emp24/gp25L/p24 family/GOLD-domain-containing protein [Thelephora terrestris]